MVLWQTDDHGLGCFGHGGYLNEIALLAHAHHLLVELDAGPRIGGGILLLCVGQAVGFPVAQPLGLADTLAHEVGIEFLQTQVVQSHILGYLLYLDECAGVELASAPQSAQVIVP